MRSPDLNNDRESFGPVADLKRLLVRIENVRRRRRAWQALAITVALTSALLLFYHLWDLWLTVAPGVRELLGWMFPVVLALGTGYALAILFGPIRMDRTAKRIEELWPELRKDVTTVVQCSKYELYSSEILSELAKRCLADLENRLEISVVGRRMFLWPLLLPVIFLVVIGASQPAELGLSLKRLVDPWGEHGDWSGIGISPGDARIPEGEELLISIANCRQRAWAVVSIPGSRWMMIPIPKSDQGLSVKLPRAQTGYQYRILLGRRQSRNYDVIVYRPLVLQEIRLTIEPPSYTGIEPMSLVNQASFEAPAYSRVNISARANMAIESARAIFSRSKEKWGEIENDRITLSFVLLQDESYRLEAMAKDQGDTFISAEYRISCLPDQPPQVEFTDSGTQERLDSDMAVFVAGQARDDYGISKIGVGFIVHGHRGLREVTKLGPSILDTVFDYRWSIAGLGLLPGDSLVYWLEVWDNDGFRGPKVGRSQTRKLWVPTLAEMYQAMVSQDSASAAELSQLQPQQSELREQLERISRAIKQHRRLDWSQQAAMERALKDQEDLLSRLEQAAEQALESLRPQGKKLRLDAETVLKLRELRELFEQTATEEMRQAMEQLQRALERMDRREVARALENMTLTAEELKRRLDRAIAALKEMQQQRQLERLLEDLEGLIQEQKEIKSRTGSADRDEMERLARRQEQAARNLETLAEQAKQLGQRLEIQPGAGERLQEAVGSLQNKNTGTKMRQAGEKISQGKRTEAQDLQDQALKDMGSFLQAAEEIRKSISQARSRAQAKILRQRAREILSLSQQQEDLNRQIASGGSKKDLTERQQALARAGARLQSEVGSQLGPMIPSQAMGSLSQALKNMNQSSQDIMEGRNSQALAQGQQALAALNQAAVSLLEASSRAGSGGGGGDMMQELEGLSDQQAAINQQTMGLLPSPGEEMEKLTAEVRGQMARLAAEQKAVRQGLEEFNLKYQDRRDRSQRLDDLVEDMKKVAEDLEENRVDRQTVERQQRILNRLLEAQRSLQDQDFSQERKAEAGKYRGPAQALRRPSPGFLPVPADGSWRREPYPLEYQEVIERYFRSLGW